LNEIVLAGCINDIRSLWHWNVDSYPAYVTFGDESVKQIDGYSEDNCGHSKISIPWKTGSILYKLDAA